MIDWVKKLFAGLLGGWFSKKQVKLGLYGPPNSGKTTLANKMCQDWLGKDIEMGTVSALPHETREVNVQESLRIESGDGRELMFNLVDTPGIATKIDYEDFMKKGMSQKKAKKRAREATKGVIESIKWLDEVDTVLVVLDASEDPYSQVNVTVIGNLAARDIPVLIVANKLDKRKASVKKIKNAFPQYEVVGVSAKFGKNMPQLYERLFGLVK